MIRRPAEPDENGREQARNSTHANRMRPSAAATPSSAFSSPLKLSVFTSGTCSVLCRLLREDVSVVSSAVVLLFATSGLPVDAVSLDVLRVNAASRSSSSTMHLAGTRPISVVSVLSLIQDDDSDTT